MSRARAHGASRISAPMPCSGRGRVSGRSAGAHEGGAGAGSARQEGEADGRDSNRIRPNPSMAKVQTSHSQARHDAAQGQEAGKTFLRLRLPRLPSCLLGAAGAAGL